MLRLIFWPVLAPSFLFGVGAGAVMPIQVLAALQLGASEALASALVAIAGVVSLLSTVPVGATIDSLGDRRTMTWATALAGVLFGLTALTLAFPGAWSLPAFIAAIVLRAPAVVAWNLARQAVVAEALPAHQRGKAMTALGGAMRAGALVGPLGGAGLLVALPLWSVFVFAVATAAVATGLLYVPRLNATFDETTQRAKASRTDEELALGVRWKAAWFAGIAITALGVARVSQPVLVALWGTHLGWSEAQISLMVAVGAAIEMLLMVPGGYLKDRIGRSPILAICLAVYGAGFVLAPLAPTGAGFIVAVAVMSVGNGLGAGINMTIGADLSPAVGRARFLSKWAMFSQAATVGGPLAVSGVLLVASLPVAMTTIGSVAALGAAWTVLTRRVTRLP